MALLLLEHAGFLVSSVVIGDFTPLIVPCDDNCQVLTIFASRNPDNLDDSGVPSDLEGLDNPN